MLLIWNGYKLFFILQYEQVFYYCQQWTQSIWASFCNSGRKRILAISFTTLFWDLMRLFIWSTAQLYKVDTIFYFYFTEKWLVLTSLCTETSEEAKIKAMTSFIQNIYLKLRYTLLNIPFQSQQQLLKAYLWLQTVVATFSLLILSNPHMLSWKTFQ